MSKSANGVYSQFDWKEAARREFAEWFTALSFEEKRNLKALGISDFDGEIGSGGDLILLNCEDKGVDKLEEALSIAAIGNKYAGGLRGGDDFLEAIEPDEKPSDEAEMQGAISAVVSSLCANSSETFLKRTLALAVYSKWRDVTIEQAALAAKVSEGVIRRETLIWKREPAFQISQQIIEIALHGLLDIWLTHRGRLEIPVYATALFFGNISTQTEAARRAGCTRANINKYVTAFTKRFNLRSRGSKSEMAITAFRKAALEKHWRGKALQCERIECDLAAFS